MRTKCPICDKTMAVESLADWPSFPFCGPKCRTIDLGRWLGQDYTVPTAMTDEDMMALEEMSPDDAPP